MIWACSGRVLGVSRACFSLEKAAYTNFQKIDFLAIGGACAVFYDEVAHLVPVSKINFTKNFGSGQADPDRGGYRDWGIRYLE